MGWAGVHGKGHERQAMFPHGCARDMVRDDLSGYIFVVNRYRISMVSPDGKDCERYLIGQYSSGSTPIGKGAIVDGDAARFGQIFGLSIEYGIPTGPLPNPQLLNVLHQLQVSIKWPPGIAEVIESYARPIEAVALLVLDAGNRCITRVTLPRLPPLSVV